jgi:hypothetical protein
MSSDDERPKSALRAFWSSLPGVLTGVAAVIAAVGTIAALFVGGDGDGSAPSAELSAREDPTAAAGTGDADGCLGAYFSGIPEDRLDPLEAGTQNFDAIGADQTKAEPFGLTFTSNGSPVGAIRLRYFPDNAIFRIESIVDAQCAPIEDYENVSRGGDKNVLQNSDTVRIGLGGEYYDLRTIGGTTIRVFFDRYVP